MGLPGETLESFKHGLQVVAEDTKIDSIQIYNCGILPNAPMNEPSYRDFYKIKTVQSPIYLAHSSIHNREIQEYEFITISSSTFTLEDIKQEFIYSWLVQTFSSLGISEYVSKYYKKIHSLSLIEFYDIFLEYCKNENSIFGEEYQKIVTHIENGYSGKGWDHYDPKLGDIFWPFEEASWARLASNKEKLEDGFIGFIKYLEKKLGYNTNEEVLNDLIKFNVFLLSVKNDQRKIKSCDFNFDWKNFFVKNRELTHGKKTYYYQNLVIEEDPVQWAWKAIWFGRGNNSFKFHPENLQENIIQIMTMK
jgi:putative methyltransferase